MFKKPLMVILVLPSFVIFTSDHVETRRLLDRLQERDCVHRQIAKNGIYKHPFCGTLYRAIQEEKDDTRETSGRYIEEFVNASKVVDQVSPTLRQSLEVEDFTTAESALHEITNDPSLDHARKIAIWILMPTDVIQALHNCKHTGIKEIADSLYAHFVIKLAHE